MAITVRPVLAGQDRLDWETPQASAALSDVAGGDLVFVGGQSCQDFALLVLRNLEEEVQGSSEFRCDLIKFCGGDPEGPVASSRPSGIGSNEYFDRG